MTAWTNFRKIKRYLEVLVKDNSCRMEGQEHRNTANWTNQREYTAVWFGSSNLVSHGVRLKDTYALPALHLLQPPSRWSFSSLQHVWKHRGHISEVLIDESETTTQQKYLNLGEKWKHFGSFCGVDCVGTGPKWIPHLHGWTEHMAGGGRWGWLSMVTVFFTWSWLMSSYICSTVSGCLSWETKSLPSVCILAVQTLICWCLIRKSSLKVLNKTFNDKEENGAIKQLFAICRFNHFHFML